MTFDHPPWLLLLLAMPVLWLLHRRLHAPREVLVASVDALRGAQLDAQGERPRRTPDLDLVLLLGAVLALALAAAGPRWGGGTPALLVAVDTSASMLARTTTGEDVGTLAWEHARAGLQTLPGDLDLVIVDISAPRAGSRTSLSGASPPVASPLRADGLPGGLAPLLARARAERYPGVLLITDRQLDSTPDVVISGPGVAVVQRTGLVDVVLDGDEARVTVERRGGAAGVLRLRGPEQASREWPVPSGAGRVVMAVSAPPRGARATYELIIDGGSEAAALDVQRVGGVGAVRLVDAAGGGGAGGSHVRAVLATLGVRVVPERLADVDAEVLVGGAPTPLAGDDPPRLHLAAAVGQASGVEVRAASPLVAAGGVTSSGVLAAAVPAPGVAVICTGVVTLTDEQAVGEWRTSAGMLAVARSRLVLTTLDPDAGASRWHTDPSFPVFLLAALEHLAGGPDRLETLDGPPPSELLRPETPLPVADVARLAALVRSPALDPATSSGGTVLAAVGAVLLLVTTLRSAGRFSSAGRR